MHEIWSLFGFFTFLTISIQLLSGTLLAFSFVPESMLVTIVRDEEDLEDLYIDDFFWLHERGVDCIFIFSYLHLFRKLYLNIFEIETESSWKSGVFLFLLFQVVVFFGLVLCCTHLSEITLTIAANVFHTFFLFKGKFYWWFFTDKQLNTDTLIRLAYGHYLSAFYLFFLGIIHGIDIHYDWKNESFYDGLELELTWWDEAFSNEIFNLFNCLFFLTVCFFFLFHEPEALSYELFMWGDIGFVIDVRFYGVAPHWYFRPFMAWLVACPFHKIGVFGLLFFFFALYFQPNLHGTSEQNNYAKKILSILNFKFKRNNIFTGSYISIESNLYFQTIYAFFIMCCFYTTSFLPYGRFFQRVGGNWGFLLSYFFVFCYLAFSWLRRPVLLELVLNYLYAVTYYLRVNNIKQFSVNIGV
jgi:quinol-cytochrome oxidoreductase complex cytochrome b subunit